MLDISMLGTGGGMPVPERFLSAALIRYEGRKILVDCGEGTQIAMKLLGWGFKTLDAICITHVHGDHIISLPGLLMTLGNSGKKDPLTIIGPKGITKVVEGLRVIVPEVPYPIEIIENPSDTINICLDGKGSVDIDTIELDHSIDCIGYSFKVKRSKRFDREKAMANDVPKRLWSTLQKQDKIEYEGKTYESDMVLGEDRKGLKVSYITDTRPIDTIPPFIKDSDLFICEGNYGSDEDYEKAIKNKHMTFRESALLAREGNVEKLVLTHFSPALGVIDDYIENAREEFENTIAAEDRMIFTLNFPESTS